MAKGTLIVIHGVGGPPPGAGLLEVSEGLGASCSPGEQVDLVIQGVRYPRLQVEHPDFDEIVEVNWSDVSRPSTSVGSVLDYWVRIVVALLEVGTTHNQSTANRGFCTRFYRAFFEAGLVYCIYPALLSLLWATLAVNRTPVTLCLGVLAVAAVAGITVYLSRFRGFFWVGWTWTAVVFSLTAYLVCWGPSSSNIGNVVFGTAIAYVVVQAVITLLLMLAMIEQWFSRRSVDRRIVSIGLLYWPFFIASAVGAVMWAVALASVRALAANRTDIRCWNTQFVGALSHVGYNLPFIEWTLAGFIALIGVALLIVMNGYRQRATLKTSNPRTGAGEFARNWARNIVGAGALGFGLLLIAYVTVPSLLHWRGHVSVLEVYGISSLRMVPYLPILTGPLAVVGGITVDVLFYLVSPGSIVSTAERLQARLRHVMEYALKRRNAPVMVAAHSQGTVIAVDVLGRDYGDASGSERSLALITAGSPLETLYDRFLGSTPESRAAAAHCRFTPPGHWINVWREGDYIGGPQLPDAAEEVDLGLGGHTHYWRSRKLWDHVLQAVESWRVPAPPDR